MTSHIFVIFARWNLVHGQMIETNDVFDSEFCPWGWEKGEYGSLIQKWRTVVNEAVFPNVKYTMNWVRGIKTANNVILAVQMYT